MRLVAGDMTFNVAVIIPARGGSKRVPRKNIREFCGQPLISWVIETALAANRILLEEDVILHVNVSTEDPEIAERALLDGVCVIPRPDELAGDDVPTVDVLHHAVDHLKGEGFQADWCLCLYPTSPLLRASRVVEAVRMMKATGGDDLSLVSVVRDRGHFWDRDRRFYPRYDRQLGKMRALYRENGAIYAYRCLPDVVKKALLPPKTIMMRMDRWENVDIDTQDDWDQAELMMRLRLVRERKYLEAMV